tara:strand:+ start:102 stop:359 length:258 start_codon:yes stop_codon:yes gene_type:complete
MDIEVLVEMFTGISWFMYFTLMLISLPALYQSVWEFLESDEPSLALFAFLLPVSFCAGWGLAVYCFPLLSGALMSYFLYNNLKNT